MSTFVVLISETDQGETQIRNSVERADRFQATAEKFDVKVREILWMKGQYDGVVIFDAPDAESATALLYHLTTQGSVRAQCMQAWDAKQVLAILDKAEV